MSSPRSQTHPLFIQFHELLCDLGRVEGQPQALDVELRNHVLQHFLQGQSSGCWVLCRWGNGILQDWASQGHELKDRHELRWRFSLWEGRKYIECTEAQVKALLRSRERLVKGKPVREKEWGEWWKNSIYEKKPRLPRPRQVQRNSLSSLPRTPT